MKFRVCKLKKIQYGWQAVILEVLTLKIKTSAHSHKQHIHEIWNWNSKTNSSYTPETMPPNPETRRSNMSARSSFWKWHQIYRLLPIHTGNVLLYFGSDIQSQTKVRVLKPKKIQSWKWHCWKSTGFCLWLQSTCTWNLKLKFQSKLDLRSGNHVTHRQMQVTTIPKTGLR